MTTTNKPSAKRKPRKNGMLHLAHAVEDAYLLFDQEDYCKDGIKRCGECWGCLQYGLLKKAYKIAINTLYTKQNYKSL